MNAIELRNKLIVNKNLCRLDNRGNIKAWFSIEEFDFSGEVKLYESNRIEFPFGHYTNFDGKLNFWCGYWQHFGGRCSDIIIFGAIKPTNNDKVLLKYNNDYFIGSLDPNIKYQYGIENNVLGFINHGIIDGCSSMLSHPLAGFEVTINNIIVSPANWHPKGFINVGRVMIEELTLYMAKNGYIDKI
ncbi:hypothetical protein [Vallitalea sp.]|jgi:hypothetical protein|uniref:hypothetical protein n=1 Tax=Vallitalea sp. TaxID=1882829 RepID=UPI0025D2A70D|nr:hypothetical protein [Vallitalea sp.]MCT4687500.1 hypothetical protein [Vallitalea sp.]